MMGVADDLTVALNSRLVVAWLAPTCADALRALGVTPHVVPELSRMGPLIAALGDSMAQQRLLAGRELYDGLVKQNPAGGERGQLSGEACSWTRSREWET
jgi:hypothetical protein